MPREAMAMTELLILLLLSISTSAALTTDGLALLAFKSAVSDDPTRALAAWIEFDDNPCSWTGVTCHLGRVVALALPDRELAGYLPSELSLLSELQYLSLPGNSLSGPLPVTLSVFRGLTDLDLSRNNLSGVIPSEIGLLTSLTHLDLSSNLLTGPLPPPIAALPHLSGVLNLSFNHLSGPIPLAFGSIPVDVSLDLRQNNLSGEIPQVAPLLSQGPTAFSGNPSLCGFPLKNACPAPKQVPKIPKANPSLNMHPSDGTLRPIASEKRKSPASTVAILAVVLLIALAAIFVLQWKLRRRRYAGVGKEPSNQKSSSPGFSASVTGGSVTGERREGHVSELYAAVDERFGLELEELLRSSAYVVGKGRSGIVYKVVVGRECSAVAVRRLSENEDSDGPSSGDEWRRRRAFESEAIAIGRAKHPNVVRLVAYYYAPEERLLIYEYIPNGSLHAALHGGHLNPTAPTLPWATRLSVLQGAARGLAYLHEFNPRKHAHGSISSNKILLDDNLRPHISGFGLARLVAAGSQEKLAYSSKIVASPRAAAGYTPPEMWGATGASTPTQKGDVYSFGVVALEAVTGRAADAELEGWVRQAFREERPLSEVVDPALLHEVHAKPEVLAVFHIALRCTEADSELRPRMRAVAENLDRISSSSQ
ncbi:receptor protein kinase-like protein ZAR1 [Zingiber officinale]|uniref:Protein kinase domain-containing protein n=1 Tax=Zingiber officinale TaxID=94328 RepID=A0A8J5L7T8_ZINOF|nr:receptor protein kinase-like protein ZAR1 [Zingiber officinale]KAG6503201.1 hypothetical protein ZIOFF_035512 [Zingiber officinale]